jgi:hypothetical protein
LFFTPSRQVLANVNLLLYINNAIEAWPICKIVQPELTNLKLLFAIIAIFFFYSCATQVNKTTIVSTSVRNKKLQTLVPMKAAQK